LKADHLMAKAIQAAASAKVLFDTGDVDGACNRAYYAMFDAARAALLASGAAVEPEIARTHNGLISAFSLHLVKTRRVPIELGKALNRAEELRLAADYKGDPIDKEDAAWAVSQAQAFVQAMEATFMPKPVENNQSNRKPS
jgi:uncharacterized protein (UPF0332 family)